MLCVVLASETHTQETTDQETKVAETNWERTGFSTKLKEPLARRANTLVSERNFVAKDQRAANVLIEQRTL